MPEIAFAPKELKVAQDLSQRLGYWTYQSRSHSRPTLLSGGRRSTTESDQRRALMLPQELIQMDPGRLLLLRAGLPPVRGQKIVYWREGAFRRRVQPPPVVPPRASTPSATDVRPSVSGGANPDADLTLDLVLPALEAAGLEPPPAPGATEEEVAGWVDRFIDATVTSPAKELDHAR